MEKNSKPYRPEASGTAGDAGVVGNSARVTSPEQAGLAHASDLPRVTSIAQLYDKTGPNATPFAGRGLPAAVAPPPRPAEVVMPWQGEPGGIDRVPDTQRPPSAEKTLGQPVPKAPGTPDAGTTRRSPRAERADQAAQMAAGADRAALPQRASGSDDQIRVAPAPVEAAPRPAAGVADVYQADQRADAAHVPDARQDHPREPLRVDSGGQADARVRSEEQQEISDRGMSPEPAPQQQVVQTGQHEQVRARREEPRAPQATAGSSDQSPGEAQQPGQGTEGHRVGISAPDEVAPPTRTGGAGGRGHTLPPADSNDGPQEPRIPPEVRGLIARMEETLVGHPDDGSKAAGLAINLWREGKISSYADFEVALRSIGSRIHFVAYPKELLPRGDTLSYPEGCSSDAGDPEYALFTAHEGAAQAERVRLSLGGVSKEENLRRLRLAGRIVIPSERKNRE